MIKRQHRRAFADIFCLRGGPAMVGFEARQFLALAPYSELVLVVSLKSA